MQVNGPSGNQHLSMIDPWIVIERISANTNISPEDRAAIRAVHDLFERVGGDFSDDERVMDAIRIAFVYGTLIGSHVVTSDPDLVTEIVRLRSRLAGQRSGAIRSERPWHGPAAEAAREHRRMRPTISQEQLAEKISEHLCEIFDERSGCRVGTDTIKNFISKLERGGSIPPRQKLGG